MVQLSRVLPVVGIVWGALIVTEVRAEPPSGGPKGPEVRGNSPGKSGEPKTTEKAGEGHGADKHGPNKDKDKDKDKDKSDRDGQGSGARGAGPGAADEHAHGHRGGRPHSELRALREELKSGKLKKEDVAARLAKLRETNKERQQNHRAALKARWGEQLAKDDAKRELELHERRMARLNRMLLLAQTERTGKAADTLTERVEKLIDLETARHEKKMARISSGGLPPAPVGAPSAAVLNNEGAK